MKNRVLLLVWFAGLVLPTTPLKAQEQNLPPFDRRAIFKTPVPRHSSKVSVGPQGPAGTTQVANAAAFGGTAYTVGLTVAPTTTIPEAEEHIASDPNNPSNLVAAISDFSLRGGFNTTKYVVSTNNGTGWIESFVPLDEFGFGFLETGDGFFWFANSDPVVAIDRAGNVFLADLYLDAFDNGNGFYVSTANLSTGVNFTIASTLPVATNPDAFTNLFEDKPWITVDNSNSPFTGNVYVSWTHFVGNSDFIVFARSTDHGQTWSPMGRISPRFQDGAVQGSQVAVGPNGEVYIVYEVFFVGNRRQHYLAKSVDGGVTFTTPVAITPLFNELTFNSTYRKNSFASLAVGPITGSDFVYVTYSDQPATTAQVEFTRSTTPGGASFTSPVVINDVSTGQHFFSALTVDSLGVIHTSWFDTRNSPTQTSLYDVFATFSNNNGASFTPNARVTGTTINAGRASFIGDYSGIAAGGGFAHPVWTSGGFNNGRLQTATLQVP
jgi:hypothetical protein